MRKWLWIGTVAAAFAIVGGAWYGLQTANRVGLQTAAWQGYGYRAPQDQKGDGDTETSDTIEPLIVDNGAPPAQSPEPPIDDTPLPRVELVQGVTQPPRPDAEPGKVLRMPYADEEEIIGDLLNPLTRILDSNPSRPNVFDEIEKANPAEESESPDVAAPVQTEPEPEPIPDYHQYHQHCPYTGGRCPIPYPNRTMPRD